MPKRHIDQAKRTARERFAWPTCDEDCSECLRLTGEIDKTLPGGKCDGLDMSSVNPTGRGVAPFASPSPFPLKTTTPAIPLSPFIDVAVAAMDASTSGGVHAGGGGGNEPRRPNASSSGGGGGMRLSRRDAGGGGGMRLSRRDAGGGGGIRLSRRGGGGGGTRLSRRGGGSGGNATRLGENPAGSGQLCGLIAGAHGNFGVPNAAAVNEGAGEGERGEGERLTPMLETKKGLGERSGETDVNCDGTESRCSMLASGVGCNSAMNGLRSLLVIAGAAPNGTPKEADARLYTRTRRSEFSTRVRHVVQPKEARGSEQHRGGYR